MFVMKQYKTKGQSVQCTRANRQRVDAGIRMPDAAFFVDISYN